jgi:hypothetical protein
VFVDDTGTRLQLGPELGRGGEGIVFDLPGTPLAAKIYHRPAEPAKAASPRFLIDFLTEDGVTRRELPDSGRSAPTIINLANHLIDWANKHPNAHVQSKRALTQPHIKALNEGNPVDSPFSIELHTNIITADEERRFVAASVKAWLERNPTSTVAILVTNNKFGTEIVKVLRGLGVSYDDEQPPDLHGFAYEGASMALAISDRCDSGR